MLLAVEVVLCIFLVLIFIQSIPLLSPKRYKPTLKNEEIVCMIILIASILTGTIGWEIYGASMEQIFSRYFVLLLAFVDRKSTRLNSSHVAISYAVFCLKKKK